MYFFLPQHSGRFWVFFWQTLALGSMDLKWKIKLPIMAFRWWITYLIFSCGFCDSHMIGSVALCQIPFAKASFQKLICHIPFSEWQICSVANFLIKQDPHCWAHAQLCSCCHNSIIYGLIGQWQKWTFTDVHQERTSSLPEYWNPPLLRSSSWKHHKRHKQPHIIFLITEIFP